MASPPVADAARELDIRVVQVGNVNEPAALEEIRGAEAEMPVLCAFGQLIGEELLDGPPILNIHPSLLPRWRGAAPIERAIMAGDAETGVTVMRLTSELDAGPIALTESVPIGPDDDFASLATKLANLGGELIVRALDLAAAGGLEFTEQDDGQATYAEKIAPEDRRLDPGLPADRLERQVRALHPHIGAQLLLADDTTLGIRQAAVADPAAPGESAVAGELEPGVLVAVEQRLLLGCSEGALEIGRLTPPGGREMTAAEYLRGHPPPAVAPMRED